ncbi:MAG: Pr6Pr family membrane protein [Microbacteriaceae bacterium]|nr:Pr6Pr family membrane protein [Microbacteriaceae bacterium]
MKLFIPALRTAFALLGLTAIVSTFFDTATRATINPFNFFGFFTMQSNIFLVVVLLVAALVSFSGKQQSHSLMLVRGCVTTYIVITGVVYNLLLAGQEGGVTLVWANSVLHVVLPLYAALDWVIFSDRTSLPWNKLWVALIYPVLWIIVVLIRGASDGWVPYPFLNPSQGYGVVAIYALSIAVAAVVFAALIWLFSRLHLFPHSSTDQGSVRPVPLSKSTV